MRNAPAVYFPVGRGRLHLGLLVVWTLLVCALSAFWLTQKGIELWRLLVEMGVLGLAGAWAWRSWQTAPCGSLHWDGQQWHWLGRNPGAGEVTPQADWQFAMLLRWRSQTGVCLWFWVERHTAPAHWQALRRAVFAHATHGSLPPV